MVPTTSWPSSPRYSRVAPSCSSSQRTTAAGRPWRVSSVESDRDPTMGRPSAVTRYICADSSPPPAKRRSNRSEEHTSELQSQSNLVCRLLLEKKKREQQNKES